MKCKLCGKPKVTITKIKLSYFSRGENNEKNDCSNGSAVCH